MQILECFGERDLRETVAGVDVDHRWCGAAYDRLRFSGDATGSIGVEVVEEMRYPDSPVADEIGFDRGIGQHTCGSGVGAGSQECLGAQLGELDAMDGIRHGRIRQKH